MDDERTAELERLERSLGARFFMRLYELPIRGRFHPEEHGWVYRVDFSGIATVLVLDDDDRYLVVYQDQLEKWGITPEDAFEFALNRVLETRFSFEPVGHPDFPVFALSAPATAALRLLAPHLLPPPLMGSEGILFSLPSDCRVLVAPMNSTTIEDVLYRYVELIHPTYSIYSECDSPIRCDAFVWLNDTTSAFFTTWIEGGIPFATMPQVFEPLWWPRVARLARERASAASPGGDGEPSCIVSYTNTRNGRVIVLSHDARGRPVRCLDDFVMEILPAIKTFLRDLRDHEK